MSISRSLAKHGPDPTALHSPRWREEADVPVKSLGEQVPIFYTRAGAVFLCVAALARAWSGNGRLSSCECSHA